MRQLGEVSVGVLKKHHIRPAKMIWVGLLRVADPVLRASTPTIAEPLAGLTHLRQIGLPIPKFILPVRIEHVHQPVSREVPQLP